MTRWTAWWPAGDSPRWRWYWTTTRSLPWTAGRCSTSPPQLPKTTLSSYSAVNSSRFPCASVPRDCPWVWSMPSQWHGATLKRSTNCAALSTQLVKKTFTSFFLTVFPLNSGVEFFFSFQCTVKEGKSVIVFAGTKNMVDRLHENLRGFDYITTHGWGNLSFLSSYQSIVLLFPYMVRMMHVTTCFVAEISPRQTELLCCIDFPPKKSQSCSRLIFVLAVNFPLGAVQKWRQHPILVARTSPSPPPPVSQSTKMVPYFRLQAPPTDVRTSAFSQPLFSPITPGWRHFLDGPLVKRLNQNIFSYHGWMEMRSESGFRREPPVERGRH